MRVTFPYELGPYRVLELLGLDAGERVPLPYGRYMYTEGLAVGAAKVYWNHQRPEMGICFDLSGTACREYEHAHALGLDVWANVYHSVVNIGGGQFARLDLAIDDRAGAIDLDQVCNAYDDWDDQVRSRFKATSSKKTASPRGKGGQTYQFGSRTSALMVRIYDKDAEQASKRRKKGAEPHVRGHHVRVEVECKGERATEAARRLYHAAEGMEVGELVRGILRSNLNFVEPDPTDVNKARWPVALWWDAFLADVGKVKLTLGERVVRQVEQAKAWLVHQVAPTLAAIFHAEGTSKSGRQRAAKRFYSFLMTSGEGRLKEHHELMVQTLRPGWSRAVLA